MKSFLFEPIAQEEMPFEMYFLSGFLSPFCSAECNHLCNFGRGYYEEQFCEIILNLGQWFMSTFSLKILIWSSGGPLFGGARPFMQF